MSVGSVMTSVDHDCWPKNARLKTKMTQPTECVRGTSMTHGISAALSPSAVFRDAFADQPRRRSQLESAPPHSDPTPEAAYGIQPTLPAVLMSRRKVSKRNFGSQNR